MLKLCDTKDRYNAIWLVEPGVTVGRLATNHMVIRDPSVAKCQFEIRVKNGHFILKNKAPSHALSVNGQPVVDGYVLRESDVISLGAVQLKLVDPHKSDRAVVSRPTGWMLRGDSAALADRKYPLQAYTLVGRSSDCDIALPSARLSRRHAQLQVVDGHLYVKDLGSANGTYLNGKRVTEARVRRGDELCFDTFCFAVRGPLEDARPGRVRYLQYGQAPASLPAAKAPSTLGEASLNVARRPRSAQKPHPHSRRSNGAGLLWLMLLVVTAVGSFLLYLSPG